MPPLKIPFTQALIDQMKILAEKNQDQYDPRVYMSAARAAVSKVAEAKAALCWNTNEGAI